MTRSGKRFAIRTHFAEQFGLDKEAVERSEQLIGHTHTMELLLAGHFAGFRLPGTSAHLTDYLGQHGFDEPHKPLKPSPFTGFCALHAGAEKQL